MSQGLPPPRPLSMPDPIRAASLPFDLKQPPQVTDGQWSVAFNLGPNWVTELQYGANRDGLGIAPDTSFRLVVAYTR